MLYLLYAPSLHTWAETKAEDGGWSTETAETAVGAQRRLLNSSHRQNTANGSLAAGEETMGPNLVSDESGSYGGRHSTHVRTRAHGQFKFEATPIKVMVIRH
jgi:hypothetical protein